MRSCAIRSNRTPATIVKPEILRRREAARTMAHADLLEVGCNRLEKIIVFQEDGSGIRLTIEAIYP